MSERLTKEEKKALRKLEWEEKLKLEQRNASLKKYAIWAGSAFFILLTVLGLYFLVTSPSPSSNIAVNVKPVSESDITEGPKDAKITLIEYADFQCPACSAYHPIVTEILNSYKNQIFYVYRMFPLTSIHKNAVISSKAAYAAHKQGAFFTYDDLLYANQAQWADLEDPKGTFIDYAKTLKLNTDQFVKDMNSKEAEKFVETSERNAKADGIMGTPTFILNGVKIDNPSSLEEFKKLIDNELNAK